MGTKHSPRFERLVESIRPGIRELSIEDVRAKLPDVGRFHLIDVREESEFAVDRLPGARSLSKGVIERDVEVAIPDAGAEIVLYCGGGYRSALAADMLQKMGYTNVTSLDGGWKAWKDSGAPTE
ncbi:MAG: rhodanese-like domain-containing protein [Candidatus Binatia bacterium]